MPDADVPKKPTPCPYYSTQTAHKIKRLKIGIAGSLPKGYKRGGMLLLMPHQSPNLFPKLIMFLYGFLDVPSATHTLWKDDKVSFTKRYRLTVCGRYCYLAFNNQTGFFVVVVPGKHRRLLAPNGPRPAAKFVDRFHRGIFCYFNLHRKKVFCSIKGIYERTLYTNENKMLSTLHVVRHVVSHVNMRSFSQVSTFW